MFGLFRTHGMTVAHARIFNQTEVVFGTQRLVEVCALNRKDALPVLGQVWAWIGSAPKDYQGLRSKVSVLHVFGRKRFVIHAADTVALLDALAQIVYRELDMPVSPLDILRGITEHG